MKRKTAREELMKIIYQMDVNKDNDFDQYLSRIKGADDQSDYLEEVLGAYKANSKKIDEMIGEFSPDWKVDRIPKIDMAILREAVTEISFIDDIPYAVSINEAVEMAKVYGTENAEKFINAILGNVVRKYGA